MTHPDIPHSEKPAPVKGAGRGLRVALFVSLALNLAVAGVVAGVMLRGGRHPVAVRDLGFGAFTESLTNEDRAALRRAFLAGPADIRDVRRQLREDGAALLSALRADPFDPAVLRAVIERNGTRAEQRQKLGQELIFAHIAAMTPQARANFAERLEKGLMRRGPRDGARDRGPEQQDR